MEQYTTYGEVQDYLTAYYKKNNTKLTVTQAIQQLKEQGQLHQNQPLRPNFDEWDFTKDHTLVSCIRQTPILISEVQTPDAILSNSVWKLKSITNFFIAMAFYNAAYDFHTNTCYTIFYVLNGSCRLWIQNDEYTLQSGDLYIISPDTPLSESCMPGDLTFMILVDKDCFTDTFSALLYQDSCLTELFQMLFMHRQNAFAAFHLPPARPCYVILQQLLSEFQIKDRYSAETSLSYLKILFSMLLRNQELPPMRAQKKNGQLYIPSILNYMESHVETVTLPVMAQKFHFSESYLSRIIHQAVGKTFQQILMEFRIEKAKQLLLESDLCISEISKKVGYPRLEHFSRIFRRETGCTPRQFRKRGFA